MTHTTQLTLTSPVQPSSSPSVAKVALRKTIRQRSFYSLSQNADRTDFASEELDLVDAAEEAVEAPPQQLSGEPEPEEADGAGCGGCGGVEDVLDDWPMKVGAPRRRAAAAGRAAPAFRITTAVRCPG